jgi:hypothetical protein
MARHYRTTLVPARAYKPKDKAADENMVGNVSRRIIAVLRNKKLLSRRPTPSSISVSYSSKWQKFQKPSPRKLLKMIM